MKPDCEDGGATLGAASKEGPLRYADADWLSRIDCNQRRRSPATRTQDSRYGSGKRAIRSTTRFFVSAITPVSRSVPIAARTASM